MNAIPETAAGRIRQIVVSAIGAGALLGLVAGAIAALSTSEKWLVNAKVLLQIGPETAGSRPSMVGSPAPFLAGNPRREDVQTEVELLSSSDLLSRAFERFLHEDPEGALGKEKGFVSALLSGAAETLGLLPVRTREERALDKWAASLRIAVVPSSTVLVLESRSERPQAAEKLLQAMLDIYLEDHRRAFGGRGMSPVLGSYLSDREAALAKAEQALTDIRSRLAIVDVVAESEQLLTRRSAAETTIHRLEGELAAATARKQWLTKLLEQTPAELRTSSEQRANPTRDALDLRLANALEQETVALQQYPDDSPQVRQAHEVVTMLKGLVAQATPTRADGVTTGRDPLHDSLRDLLAKADTEVQGLTAELQVARRNVEAIAQRLLAIEAGRPALQKAEQDVTEAKKDLIQAREGLRMAQVEQVLDEHKIANVTVVTPPNHLPTPLRSFGLPTRIAMLLGCLAFGISAGIALHLWRKAGAQGEVPAAG